MEFLSLEVGSVQLMAGISQARACLETAKEKTMKKTHLPKPWPWPYQPRKAISGARSAQPREGKAFGLMHGSRTQ